MKVKRGTFQRQIPSTHLLVQMQIPFPYRPHDCELAWKRVEMEFYTIQVFQFLRHGRRQLLDFAIVPAFR